MGGDEFTVILNEIAHLEDAGQVAAELIEAVTQRDYPVIQGVILVASLAYVLINLLIDVGYVLLDPRIRY